MNIISQSNNPINRFLIPELKAEINKVLRLTGEKNIVDKWIIFEPSYNMRIPSIVSIATMNPKRSSKGYCKCVNGKWEVYISASLLLKKSQVNNMTSYTKKFTNQELLSELTDVIIHELAHVKTDSDHNSKQFKETYMYYYKKCLGHRAYLLDGYEIMFDK